MERIGNYRIDGELGRSATDIVYEARHLVLPRRAIVKVMAEHEPLRALAVQLLREACILEALEHPGVVRVYESGLLPDRRPWFARERIDGATVADLLAGGPLDPAQALALVRDIAEVLEHSHRRGVVHCDLRPDRIVITGRTRGFPVCIIDWGDARVHDTSAPLPDLAIRDYAAPELLDGTFVDDRADVFSLGAIAYEALTGTLPYAESATSVTGEIQHVPAEVRCSEAPPQLTSLVDQMLAWERFDRPSIAEIVAELTQLALDMQPPAPARPDAAMNLRIRRPRWTPSLPVEAAESAEADVMVLDVADET